MNYLVLADNQYHICSESYPFGSADVAPPTKKPSSEERTSTMSPGVALPALTVAWEIAKLAVETWAETHKDEPNFSHWLKKYLTTIRMSPGMRTKLTGLASVVRAGSSLAKIILPSISERFNELEALPGTVVSGHMAKTLPALLDTSFNTQDVDKVDTDTVNPDMVLMDPTSLNMAYAMYKADYQLHLDRETDRLTEGSGSVDFTPVHDTFVYPAVNKTVTANETVAVVAPNSNVEAIRRRTVTSLHKGLLGEECKYDKNPGYCEFRKQIGRKYRYSKLIDYNRNKTGFTIDACALTGCLTRGNVYEQLTPLLKDTKPEVLPGDELTQLFSHRGRNKFSEPFKKNAETLVPLETLGLINLQLDIESLHQIRQARVEQKKFQDKILIQSIFDTCVGLLVLVCLIVALVKGIVSHITERCCKVRILKKQVKEDQKDERLVKKILKAANNDDEQDAYRQELMPLQYAVEYQQQY